MRRLLLLRHAKTERASPGEDDRDRKLTKRGRADASVIGAYMARHGYVPDLALVSPAMRAGETWVLVVAAIAKELRVVKDKRIYNAGPEKLISIIRETHDAHTLLIIGHNPGLHELAMRSIATGEQIARERVTEKLPTSGLVVIEFPFDDWSLLRPNLGRLERFVSPRLMAATTD
jgi:phosphohistidine phosphatase